MENASKMEKKTRTRAGVQSDFQHPLPKTDVTKDGKSKRKNLSKSSSRSKTASTQQVTQQDPDVTSDFASGWTPYKKVAKTVAAKQQSQGISKKRTQPKAEKPENDENIAEKKSSAATVLTDSDRDLSKQEAVPSCSSSVGLLSVKQEGKVCIACGATIDRDEHSSHVKICLKKKFQRDQKDKANVGAKGHAPRSSRLRYVLCQICQEDISEMSTDDQQKHVNDCLDGKNVTASTAATMIGPHDVVQAADEEYRCQICGKVLTKMNTQRRLQHINKCIDMAKPEEVTTNGNNENNGNSARQKPKRGTRNKKGPGRNTRADNHDNERVKRLEEPTSKLDEETQLALALSESMRNDDKFHTTELGTSQLLEHVKDEKDAFSILMSQKTQEKAPKKRRGKNAVPLPVPKLVATTEQERARKLEEKIATLLPSQETTDLTSTPSFPKTRSREANEKNEPLAENMDSRLWVADTAHIIGQVMNNQFYVDELPQVAPSTVKAGSKIKKMGYIPGWKPINDVSTTVDQHTGRSFETTSNETMFASTQTAILLAELADDINSTVSSGDSVRPNDSLANQTSVEQFPQQSNLNPTSKHNKTVHFQMSDAEDDSHSPACKMPSQMIDHSTAALQVLSSDLEKLVDDPMGSDFSILCKDDVNVSAHSIIIRVRCPALLEASSNSRLSLPSCSDECVKSLLKFIYAGNMDVPVELIPELKSLADMFELPLLEKSCLEIRRQHAANLDATLSNTQEVPAPMSHKLIDKTLQNFLSEVWSSDSESEVSSIDEENAGVAKMTETDRLGMDDLYELVASQREDNSRDKSRSGSSDEDNILGNNARSKGVDHTCIDAALMQRLEESFMVDSAQDKSEAMKESMYSDQESSASSIENTDLPTGCQMDIDFGETTPAKQFSVLPTGLNCFVHSADSPIHVYSNIDTEGMEITSSIEDLTDHKCVAVAIEPTEDEDRGNVTENSEDISRNMAIARNLTHTPIVENSSSHIERTPDLFGTPDDSDDMCTEASQKSISSRKRLRESYDQFNSGITSPPDDLFDFSLTSENDCGDANLMNDECDELCTTNVPIEAVTTGCSDSPEDQRVRGSPSLESIGGDDDIQITCEIKGHRNRVGDYGSPVISEKILGTTKGHAGKSPRNAVISRRDLCRSPSLPDLSEVQPKETLLKTSKKRSRSPTILSESLENSPKRSKYNCRSNEGSSTQKSSQYDPTKNTSSIQPSHKKSNTEDSMNHMDDSSDCVVDLTSEEINDNNLPELDGGEMGNDSILNTCPQAGAHKHDESKGVAFENDQQGNSIDLSKKEALMDNEDQSWQSPNGADDHQSQGDISGLEGGSIVAENGSDESKLNEQEKSKTVHCDMDNEEGEQAEYDQDDVWEGYDDIEAACVDPFLPSSPEDAGLLHFSMSPVPGRGSQKSTCNYALSQDNKSTSKTVISPSHWKTPGKVLKHPGVSRLTPSTSRGHKSTCTPRGMQSGVNERSFGEFDPPTDMESDVSMALKDANDSILWSNENNPEPEPVDVVKAPVLPANPKPKKKKSNKKWVPPSPFTPLPNYAEMITPELKKNCQKVGVRALPKKKMIVLLHDVFKRTHQYETDSDYDGSPPPRAPASVPVADSQASPEIYRPSKSSRVSRGRGRGRGRSNIKDGNIASKGAPRKKTEQKKSALDIDARDDDLGNSQELDSSSCSQDSTSVPDLPEESMIVIEEGGEKNTKLSKRDVAYKKQCIWNFIEAHPEIYESMLHYETLDFPSFHQQLKDSGLTFGVAIVMDFLDEQNIQFTLKNQQARQRRQKKAKDRQTRKKVASSQSQRK